MQSRVIRSAVDALNSAFLFVMLGALPSFVAPACAQDVLVSVSVEPKGAPYQVDGVMYYAPTSFAWPAGSKHTLAMMTTCQGTLSDACQTRYTPSGWSAVQGGQSMPLDSSFAVITADPRISAYKGQVSVQHLVRVSFFDAGGGTANPVAFPRTPCLGDRPGPGGPGLACVNGQCYRESVDLWLDAGDVTLSALPYNGYVFKAWYTGTAAQPFLTTYTVSGPTVLHARFEPAKRVVITTDPPELRILVDRSDLPTGDPDNYIPTCAGIGIFDFAEGSTHVLAAPSPQMDKNGVQWVFDKWSNGGGQNMVYKAEQTNITDTLVAKFVRGVRVNLLVPKGLKLIVDGRDNWPSLDFSWGAGTRHVVTAPPEQTDENGRKYVFKGWSNGGSATQELTLSSTDFTPMHIRAEYELLGMVKVHSNMRVPIQVGTETCETPCVLHRTAGTELPLSVPETVPLSEDSRVELQSLDGGPSGRRTVQFTTDGVLLVANYRPTYRVSVGSDPQNGADIRIEPASQDSFYPANTLLRVYSVSRLGYRFKRWEGDTVDRFSPATVTVTGPVRLRAILEPIAEISRAGVKNGVGDTPVAAVAPGSIVSIYGANLAPRTEAGPTNPLAQSIAGVTVHVSDRILPLLFVSPEQINAQLPYDLPLGTHTLTVKARGMADVSTTFEVVRNAPGLLTFSVNGRMTPLMSRGAGAAIDANNPVRAGEVVSIFGTGFGPHRIAPPEVFGVNESAAFRLIDPVEVVVGENVIAPEYAGPAAGLPGVINVRFRMPTSLAGEELLRVKVIVNGADSNGATLPNAAAFAAEGAGPTSLVGDDAGEVEAK